MQSNVPLDRTETVDGVRARAAGVVAGILFAIGAFVVYWLSNRAFDAGRGDFFYLADAFVHGRVWIEFALGPNDVIYLRAGT